MVWGEGVRSRVSFSWMKTIYMFNIIRQCLSIKDNLVCERGGGGVGGKNRCFVLKFRNKMTNVSENL